MLVKYAAGITVQVQDVGGVDDDEGTGTGTGTGTAPETTEGSTIVVPSTDTRTEQDLEQVLELIQLLKPRLNT